MYKYSNKIVLFHLFAIIRLLRSTGYIKQCNVDADCEKKST